MAAAAHAVEYVGLPEAQLNLAQAVIALALAPKSNAVIMAIDAASADVRAAGIALDHGFTFDHTLDLIARAKVDVPVVLFGSAVAGEHRPKTSDYNVLVIVDALPLDRLRAVAAVSKAW